MTHLRISLTIILSSLLLFLFGCGADEPDKDNFSSSKTDALGSITGKVLNENGSPVSGAIVTTEPETSQVITAADGSYEIPTVASRNYTVWARTSDREGKAEVSVKGGVAKANIRLTELPPPPPDKEPPPIIEPIIEITFPKPNDKVEWRARITGKLRGAKDLKALKAALNLNDETLKIRLWVWDPMDPHGPWIQPPAMIQNNLEWFEDEPAWFGRPGGIDVGKAFNVKVELAVLRGNDIIPIDKVEPVTITNVIRK